MKKILLNGVALMAFLLMATPVEAKGTAKVEFKGENTIEVGDTFTVYMQVADIRDTYDGVVSFGGNLVFDANKLEYVSSKGVETPYLFQMNEKSNYKIAGLDFTLDNGIKENLVIYEFTFRALQDGETTINFANAKLTDSHDYIDTIVAEKNILVTNAENKDVPVIENKIEKIKEEKIENKSSDTKRNVEKAENKSNVTIKVAKEENTKVTDRKEKETLMNTFKNVCNHLFSEIKKLFK